ncbi:hypothetical protein [Arthrobacter sp. PAMC25284]|uniref:hypothetical protein n=1 Tax=Arthrobacter sp. PAMC25284 TaxID=2861279 RepID=UPI001C636CED|nr:hypothetical protein [Arthrobacter sp. PAMC25284]QYF88990.1 hypothetical protein KY499_12470 [Arthrobacter sp. PAMC25284]
MLETAAGWLAEPDANTAWVLRHGLRTLVKKANPGALALELQINGIRSGHTEFMVEAGT